MIVNMDAVERMNYDSCEIDGMTFMLSRDSVWNTGENIMIIFSADIWIYRG